MSLLSSFLFLFSAFFQWVPFTGVPFSRVPFYSQAQLLLKICITHIAASYKLTACCFLLDFALGLLGKLCCKSKSHVVYREYRAISKKKTQPVIDIYWHKNAAVNQHVLRKRFLVSLG